VPPQNYAGNVQFPMPPLRTVFLIAAPETTEEHLSGLRRRRAKPTRMPATMTALPSRILRCTGLITGSPASHAENQPVSPRSKEEDGDESQCIPSRPRAGPCRACLACLFRSSR
jgi:hypothetical protein